MPVALDDGQGHKRKRRRTQPAANVLSQAESEHGVSEEDVESEILLLERAIFESRKNYNNIAKLLSLMLQQQNDPDQSMFAAVALCRSFCKLFALGAMDKSKSGSENDAVIARWLNQKQSEYVSSLTDWLRSLDSATQNTALTLILRVVKEEVKQRRDREPWVSGTFSKLVAELLQMSADQAVLETFVTDYAVKYADVRYYTFLHLKNYLVQDPANKTTESASFVMSQLKPAGIAEDEEPSVFVPEAFNAKKTDQALTRKGQMKQAQQAWVAILKLPVTKSQRKLLLNILPTTIVHCFSQVELLMDFLTDSFNQGGSTSLLALSGLFYLMQNRNLDYPQFYPRLYGLLDQDILHSKHKSRFFRLLETFLGSTHLPAALVASFIKRLSRLCLNAPPSSIVIVVPWIYNLLQNHPTCTFMIHRNADLPDAAQGHWQDPFDLNESDPMETRAIDSSLWEIQALQSHYQPNVASIAKIVSQQFTKHAYNLEDFLDHSYATMLEAEFAKDMKRPPEVEFDIPKRIMSRDSEGSNNEITDLWDFS